MKKNYVIDTNILLDDCNCIRILRNGAENKVYIPKTVLLELDHLKRDPAKRHLVSKAVDAILENFDHIEFIDTAGIENNDLKIISEIKTKNTHPNQAQMSTPLRQLNHSCGFYHPSIPSR